jgi:hypothetical protein
MTDSAKKTIDGFNCEFTDEWGTTSVMIQRGRFCSSLDFAEMHGEILDDFNGTAIPVSSHSLARIQRWADSLGY